MTADHPRPVLQPSYRFDWLIGDTDAGDAQRIAQETSWALLGRVREHPDPNLVARVIALADTDVMDDIAELWATSGDDTLAGTLWRLYLLRKSAQQDSEGAAHLFQLGVEALNTIDPYVAGLAVPPEPQRVVALIDEILRGAFTGDLADACERAAAYSKLISAGALELANLREAPDPQEALRLTKRAAKYQLLCSELRTAAHRWRHGRLS